LAALIIPPEDVHWWAPEIAAGRVEYDFSTETMTLISREKTAADVIPEWMQAGSQSPVELTSDFEERFGTKPFAFAPGIQAREVAALRETYPVLCEDFKNLPHEPQIEISLSIPSQQERDRAAKRTAEIRAMMLARA
jgi:hypothetical protein